MTLRRPLVSQDGCRVLSLKPGVERTRLRSWLCICWSRPNLTLDSMLKFRGLLHGRPLGTARTLLRAPPLRISHLGAQRFNSNLPESSDPSRDLRANDLRSRLPKFPLHKDVEPTLLPKPDTPRVGPRLTFSQLVGRLRNANSPELVYMAESHRLYFMACFALAFIAAYNFFDILDMSVPYMIKSYSENDLDATPIENLAQLVRRFGVVAAMSAAYLAAGIILLTLPTRLVRRIEFVPGTPEVLRLVTHPLVPGRPSPIIAMPLDKVRLGKRSKVWTGDGFYGTASRSSFFFLLWEDGRRIPWIVDRSGWFWGDGRVYDVLLGKEPVALAEKGLSYDELLRKQLLEAEEKKAQLRRELGPAWRAKAMGSLMKEDIQKFSSAGKKAVFASLSKPRNQPAVSSTGSTRHTGRRVPGAPGEQVKENVVSKDAGRSQKL